MREPRSTDQLLDLFLLRTKDPEYAVDMPYYTTGSIVAAALLRITVVGVVSLIVSANASSTTTWWVAMIGLWGLGVYPAWLQYQRYHENIERISQDTLCGRCRHFNPTNQSCMILDVHVTSEAPPCEGEGWEPV